MKLRELELVGHKPRKNSSATEKQVLIWNNEE